MPFSFWYIDQGTGARPSRAITVVLRPAGLESAPDYTTFLPADAEIDERFRGQSEVQLFSAGVLRTPVMHRMSPQCTQVGAGGTLWVPKAACAPLNLSY